MNADGVLLDEDIREPLFEYLESCYGKVRFLEKGDRESKGGCCNDPAGRNMWYRN